MKIEKLILSSSLLFLSCLVLPSTSFAQALTAEGEAIVGQPGDGNNLLFFNSERPWVFRQSGTGVNTNLELFSTIGLKNFMITTTGKVGIDVANPLEKLHVNGNIKASGNRISFGTSEYIEDGGSFIIQCNGSLISSVDGADDLGRMSNRWRNVWATNGTIQTSDAREKTNIMDATYGLNEILQLRPVAFNWKNRPEEGLKLGLVAQEVQQVIPEIVMDHQLERDENTGTIKKVPTDRLGMYYADLIPVLIKGMQEQQELIEQQAQKLADQKIQLQAMETKVAKMEELEQRLAKLEILLAQTKN